MLTVGSLFSGIEGFGLGFKRAGAEVVWHVEKDKDCLATIERHFGGNALTDVRTVGAHNLAAVDLICGGFPCQDLSVAGNRAGLAGERSGLWHEFHRILAELRPRWVVVENVPGLLSSNDGRDMAVVLRGLGELGYGWAYRVLDAQYFGVAQRRRRVFIVGCLGDAARAAQVLFEPESCDGDSPPIRQARQDLAVPLTSGSGVTSNAPGRRREDDVNLVAGTLKGGDSKSRRGFHDPADEVDNMVVVDEVSKALSARASMDRPESGAVSLVTHTLRAGGHDASEDGTGRGTPLVAETLRSHPRPGSNSLGSVAPMRGGGNYGQGNLDEGVPMMVRAGAVVRRLTPTECERLQGFPDGWTAGLSDSARYRMLGNAVCVPVAEWIGRRIVSAA